MRNTTTVLWVDGIRFAFILQNIFQGMAEHLSIITDSNSIFPDSQQASSWMSLPGTRSQPSIQEQQQSRGFCFQVWLPLLKTNALLVWG